VLVAARTGSRAGRSNRLDTEFNSEYAWRYAQERAAMAGSPSLVAAITKELDEEHGQVLLPLLGNLKEIADQIDRNVAVPADVVRTGLALWERYVSELLADAIHHLLVPLSPLSHPGECARRLHELREEESVESARVSNLERFLKVSASGQFGERAKFLGTLRSSIESSQAWARFEDEYASHCLVRTPAPGAEVSILRWLEKARGLRESLAAEVRVFGTDATLSVPGHART
jgi:hypothetical protein